MRIRDRADNSSNPVAPTMLQWHCIHVAFVMNSRSASTSSWFRVGEFCGNQSNSCLSRASGALVGQFASLN